MQDNKNAGLGLNCDGRGTVCIDTMRVLDCCRDRDCFEDARVYITSAAEEILASATSVRTRQAKLLWAYVGTNEVPFNKGFYQVVVRYYIQIEAEACLGIGNSQVFTGVAALEKDVILYGGDGNTITFTSSPENTFCNIGNLDATPNSDPIAVVETVEPIVLGTKVSDCDCPCQPGECCELPEKVKCCLGGEPRILTNGPRLYVSFGVFSVIRLERPSQLLIQGTDYSVPDKECAPCRDNETPCSLFRTMAFPVAEFRGEGCTVNERPQRSGGCGCGNKSS